MAKRMSLKEWQKRLERRKEDLKAQGYTEKDLKMPKNSGVARTRKKRALLQAIDETAKENGKEPPFDANYVPVSGLRVCKFKIVNREVNSSKDFFEVRTVYYGSDETEIIDVDQAPVDNTTYESYQELEINIDPEYREVLEKPIIELSDMVFG